MNPKTRKVLINRVNSIDVILGQDLSIKLSDAEKNLKRSIANRDGILDKIKEITDEKRVIKGDLDKSKKEEAILKNKGGA